MKTKIPFVLANATLMGIFNYDFANEIGNYKFWLFIGEIIVFIASILFLIHQKEKEKILIAVAIVMLYGVLTYDFNNEVGNYKFRIFICEIVLLIISVLSLIFQTKKKE